MTRRSGSAAAFSLVAMLLLGGCGSGSSATAGAPASGPTSGATSGTTLDPAQVLKIRQCLRTAGLGHKIFASPGGGLSGTPIVRPTGAPTPSSGAPITPYGGAFSDPQVVKALRICKITLPSIAPAD